MQKQSESPFRKTSIGGNYEKQRDLNNLSAVKDFGPVKKTLSPSRTVKHISTMQSPFQTLANQDSGLKSTFKHNHSNETSKKEFVGLTSMSSLKQSERLNLPDI